MLKTHNMVYITSQIAFCKNSQNVINNPQNVINNPQNVINNPQNVTETLQKGIRCYNCYKTLSSKKSLLRHLSVCNKKLSPLECEKCHKNYSSVSSLSHHRAKCIIKSTSTENNTTSIKLNDIEIEKISENIKIPIELDNNTIKEVKNNTNERNDNKIDDTSKVTNKIKNKKKIPQSVRIAVWDKYIGLVIGQKLCDICNTNNINQFNFHCAHVIAEINGGAATIENMRPICQSCNLSMGKINLNDYIKLYFNK
jgi:hypothetical protein